MWTTPLSQDQITSDAPAEFVAKVEPGAYHAWVFCGTSSAYRAQVFDFDVTSGDTTVPVLFENSYQYRDVFLKVDAAGGEAHVKLTPRNRWIVAGIVLWQDADEARAIGATNAPNSIRPLPIGLPAAVRCVVVRIASKTAPKSPTYRKGTSAMIIATKNMIIPCMASVHRTLYIPPHTV